MKGDPIPKAVLSAPPFAVPSWLRPVITPSGRNSLAGGMLSFDAIDVVQADSGGHIVCRMDIDHLLDAADDRNYAAKIIDNLTQPRPHFAGLSMQSPAIMGILNVTPDSFSDGGQHCAPVLAMAAARSMVASGAKIIDIGGESTRPGARPITRNQELTRVLPPLAGLKQCDVVLSVDTRHAEVMDRATAEGADIINDVAGLRGEGALEVVARSGCHVIIMHMQGTPETMQDNPQYGFAPTDVYSFLEKRVVAAMAAGIPREKISVDVGFGFGKGLHHNLQLVNWLAMLHGLGVPLLFGASRKSSIAKLASGEPAKQRLPGSLVLAMAAVRQGAQMLRVHDVAETAQALAVECGMLGGVE